MIYEETNKWKLVQLYNIKEHFETYYDRCPELCSIQLEQINKQIDELRKILK